MNDSSTQGPSSLTTLLTITVIIGVGAGLAGMSLMLLLHYIQHLAYGYSAHFIISQQSFLDGVRAASPLRRIMILTVCGLIAGFGWLVIYRYGRPLVSIASAVRSEKPYMPVLSTTAHAVLQIITIALGSPLGREVAPREMGAAFAIWLSSKAGLTVRETQIMLASGAGAGLAAMYNIPFGGAIFALEVLLHTFRWQAILPAILASIIATVVSWIGLGNVAEYHLPSITISYSLVIWSALCGPIFGLAAYWFNRITANARRHAPHHWQLPIFCLLNFFMIGVLAVYVPALLGNGKAAVQLGFNEILGVGFAATLLLLRVLAIWGSLRAGAQGGLLTPSLANGALLAVVLGGAWCIFWPGVSQSTYAVIGAATFLAASQKMPITAIVLIFELTGMQYNLMVPLLFCVSGAIAVIHWLR